MVWRYDEYVHVAPINLVWVHTTVSEKPEFTDDGRKHKQSQNEQILCWLLPLFRWNLVICKHGDLSLISFSPLGLYLSCKMHLAFIKFFLLFFFLSFFFLFCAKNELPTQSSRGEKRQNYSDRVKKKLFVRIKVTTTVVHAGVTAVLSTKNDKERFLNYLSHNCVQGQRCTVHQPKVLDIISGLQVTI